MTIFYPAIFEIDKYCRTRKELITVHNIATMSILGGIVFAVIIAVIVVLVILVIRVLLKYLRSKDVREEKAVTRKSLGQLLKNRRTECKMTQEFVAEALGVSRQAVSKWESGTSDPSTSNLIAIAKLFGISAEELLREVER